MSPEPAVIATDGRGGIRIPQPGEIPSREREDAMGAYLMMFASWGLGFPLPMLGLLAAVIYFFINKKTSRFVAFHALQSLLTQIPISIMNAWLVLWLIRNLFFSHDFTPVFFTYIPFAMVWNLVYVIASIYACVRARKGRFVYFLLFGRLAYAVYYGTRATGTAPEVPPNRPPEGF